jgi:DNA-binding beta-propeller fold protein YncE
VNDATCTISTFVESPSRSPILHRGTRLPAVRLGPNSRHLEHTISDIPDPQGIALSPETNKLFVVSGRGKVYIYDSKSYDQIATVDFPGGADNLRYDAATGRVYVGCGDDERPEL